MTTFPHIISQVRVETPYVLRQWNIYLEKWLDHVLDWVGLIDGQTYFMRYPDSHTKKEKEKKSFNTKFHYFHIQATHSKEIL